MRLTVSIFFTDNECITTLNHVLKTSKHFKHAMRCAIKKHKTCNNIKTIYSPTTEFIAYFKTTIMHTNIIKCMTFIKYLKKFFFVKVNAFQKPFE